MKNNIIIIRLDAIGDFFLWLSSAKYLKDLYPSGEYEITLVCSSLLKNFAEKIPFFDRVIFIDKNKYFSNPFYRWFVRIKFLFIKADTVINPIYSREYTVDKILKFIRCKNRIGIDGDLSNIKEEVKNRSNKLYKNILVPPQKECHELVVNSLFVSFLSNQKILPSVANLREYLPSCQFDFNYKYFVIIPGSSQRYKRWEPNKVISIIEKITQHTDFKCIVCGDASEKDVAEAISTNINIINTVGNTNLLALCNIISHSEFVLTNDTAALHITAALNIPSICILGGGHFGRFAPYPEELGKNRDLPICVYNKMECYNCNWKCLYSKDKTKPFPCISSISVDQVWHEVEKLLAKISLH